MSNYYLKLAIRFILLLASMVAFAWIFPDERLFFSKIILLTAIVLQIVELIRFLRKSHYLLSQFVHSIQHNDYSRTLPRNSWGRPFDQLFENLDNVLRSLRAQAHDSESQRQYLSMAFSAMDTGVISIEDDTKIVLLNERGKEILDLPDVSSFSALAQHHPDFHRAIQSISQGGDVVVRLKNRDNEFELSMSAVRLALDNKEYLHVTFRDIRAALDTREIEAWNKLTRILTHEIMNSVTPISSLSETMEVQLQRQQENLPSELGDDLKIGIGTIRRRSNSLLEFVEDYRKLTRVPQPKKETVSLQEVIEAQKQLWSPKLTEQGVAWFTSMEIDEVYADHIMIEQILINLIKNSLVALETVSSPTLRISSTQTGDWVKVTIEDNGVGIEEDELREIFVPFFTTRSEGSGIGLSLTKQMMHLHGGRITAESTPGSGTFISLWFPFEAS